MPSSQTDKLSSNPIKPIKIEFLKISYDRILTSNQLEYCAAHPEIGQHEAIDIIRDKAD
jgi:hypothetical protein